MSYLWPSRIDIAVFGVRGSPDYPKHKDNLHGDGNSDGHGDNDGAAAFMLINFLMLFPCKVASVKYRVAFFV